MSRLTGLKLRKLALATSCLLALNAGTANAAGIGKINIFSGLGQPLKAEIELTATSDELAGMTARLAPSEVFKQTGVEYMSLFSDLAFTLDKGTKGKPVIKVSSLRPINEPFLDLLVELNWRAGRIVREFTFLLDPPLSPKAVSRVSVSTVEAKPLDQLPDFIREKETPAKSAIEVAPLAIPEASRKTASVRKHSPQVLAPAEVTSQDSRLVKQGDTLAKIAEQLRPEGVSLDQMLAGLYKANPDAFIGKSIHRLKAGAVLKVPDAETASEVSESEAKKLIRAQARDWHGYRKKLAQSVSDLPAKDAVDTQLSTGKVTPKLDEKPFASEKSKDQVRVGKAEQSKSNTASKDEEGIAKDLAIKEAQQRVVALEKTVSDMQRLLEMKDQKLALLEKQGQEKTVQPKVASESPVVASEPKVTPAPTEAPIASQEKQTEPPVAEVKDKPQPAPVETNPPAPEPSQSKEAPPAPVVSQDLPDEPPELLDVLAQEPMLVGGVAAGLLAMLGGFVFWRRKKVNPDMASTTLPMSDMSLTPSSVFNGAGGQVVDTDKSPMTTADFSQTGPGSIDTDEVDPVAEADVYMAYGRDVQAEEILIEAMEKDPMRLAIPVKLLEIYANRRSVKQFEALAGEFYSRTSGLGDDWQKVAAMGALLDPHNPLYAAGGEGAGISSRNAEDVEGLEFAQTRLEPTVNFQALSEENRAHEMALDLPTAQPDKQEDTSHVLDFDVGTATNPLYALEEAATKLSDEALDSPSSDEALEFELPSVPNTEFVTSFSNAKTLAEVEAEQIPEDDSPLEFDINLSESIVMGAELPQFDISSINLDLANDVSDVSDVSLSNKPSDFQDRLDLNSLDLSLPEAIEADPTIDVEDFDPALREEVSTKLDLAKAYEEMGDVEGAKELLGEVIADGPKDLVAQAEEIMARLGA